MFYGCPNSQLKTSIGRPSDVPMLYRLVNCVDIIANVFIRDEKHSN